MGRDTKTDTILRDLRKLIVSGQYPPDCLMPNRRTLERQYDCSSVTIQRVFDVLLRERFVHAARRAGTRVSRNPPHRVDFAIVFPFRPESEAWGRFQWTLNAQAERRAKHDGGQLHVHYGVPGEVAHEQLASDIRSHRVSGVIFAVPPGEFVERLNREGMPGIVIAQNACEGLGHVAMDHENLYEQALAWVLAQGEHRRLATVEIDTSNRLTSVNGPLARLAAARAFETRPEWNLVSHPQVPQSVRTYVRLLMSLPPERRPDTLVIADDNLVQAAMIGLVDSGVRVPEEVRVLVHNNLPLPVPSVLPVPQIAFDGAAVIDAAVDYLSRSREGLPVNDRMVIRPVLRNP